MKRLICLSVEKVYKEFTQHSRTISVLQDITFQFSHGQTYAIMGVSGSGKSTLMMLLAGLDTPTSGTILFDDINFSLYKSHEKALFLAQHIGIVFQQPHLIRELSVVENVMLKGIIAGKSSVECRENAYVLLQRVGLADKALSNPTSLSGGQQHRVAIARALFSNPSFLLADEPTGNLDKKTGEELVDFLQECRELFGMGIIVSTHDEYVARKMGVVLHLRDGKMHTGI